MKKIIFDDIRFENSPLVWEWDERNNEARCTFTLAGSKGQSDIKKVLSELKNIVGITLVKDKDAIIHNVSRFFIEHPHGILTVEPLSLRAVEPVSSRGNSPRSMTIPISPRESSPKSTAIPISPRESSVKSLSIFAVKRADDPIKFPRSVSTSAVGRVDTPRHLRKEPWDQSSGSGIITVDEYKQTSTVGPSCVSSSAPVDKDTIMHRDLVDIKFIEDGSGIKIDELITPSGSNPTLWSDTLAYRPKENGVSYFIEKTQIDEKLRDFQTIRAQSTFRVLHQYTFNYRLYPLKAAVISTLQEIFDGPLSNAYEKIETPLKNAEDLRLYFQSVIQEIMKYSHVDIKPTFTELLSDEERQQHYKSPHKCAFAVKQEKIARAMTRMMDLLFYVQNDISPHALSTNETVCRILSILKTKLTPIDIQQIELALVKLQSPLVAIGELHCQKEKELAALNVQLDAHEPIMTGFKSYYCLIKQLLAIRCPKVKESDIELIVKEIIKCTIPRLSKYADIINGQNTDLLLADASFQAHVALIPELETDFYLSPEFHDRCQSNLNDPTLFKHIEKSRSRFECISNICQKLEDALVQWLLEHSTKKSLEDETKAASASSTISFV